MKLRPLAALPCVAILLVLVGACEESSDSSSGGSPSFEAGTLDAPGPDAPQATPDGAAEEASTDAAPVDAGDAANDAADAQASSGALRFDGIDDLVTIVPAAGGPSETAFTIELWFRTKTNAAAMFMVYGSTGGADRMLFTEGGKVCFYVYGPPVTVCSTTATYNDGAWHHAAATLGAVGGQRVFVDGVLAGSNAEKTASTFTGGDRLALGYGPITFNGPLLRYAGDIDDVRMWSVERTEADIAASRRVVLPGSTPGLQDYWRLDEMGTSATAKDDASDPHDGTLVGFGFSPTSGWVGPGAY